MSYVILKAKCKFLDGRTEVLVYDNCDMICDNVDNFRALLKKSMESLIINAHIVQILLTYEEQNDG